MRGPFPGLARLEEAVPALTAGVLAVLLMGWAAGGGPLAPVAPGQFARWSPDQPVVLRIDQGPLGEIGNAEASQFLRDAMAVWEIPSATIELQEGTPLPVDVGIDNFDPFLNSPQQDGNAVIFDSDGSITDAVLGDGASTTVLGFAGPVVESETDLTFDWGVAVLNGRNAQVGANSLFRYVVVHELGHLLGLDHSQGDLAFFSGGLSTRPLLPIMFPFILGVGGPTPRHDDGAWLSFMYPQPEFPDSTGTIRGRVTRRSGGPLQGANVVALPVQVGPGEALTEMPQGLVSVVSDFLITGDGTFELPGLEEGSYVVFIQPISGSFTGGSGVGPFDTRFDTFPKDYFNAGGESGGVSDDVTERTVLEVAPGDVLQDIVLISNEGSNDLSSLTDDDQELFHFPAGFEFPFFGRTYRQVTVNTDGNMTFGGGDSASSARDEARFLGGDPRIAPLFTDLNPEQGGEVSSSFDGVSLRFLWQDVPEFTRFGNPPGNTFSATLYPDGSLAFDYEEMRISAEAGLQAVVGVSPGGISQGDPVDLSALPGAGVLGDVALYEVFPGQSFDLDFQKLVLLGEEPQREFFFPFFTISDDDFTGLALGSQAGHPSALRWQALGVDGGLLPLQVNPNLGGLAPATQLARLARQLFEDPAPEDTSGWIRLGSSQSELFSFFQVANGLTDRPTRMDGGVAVTDTAERLWFTRLYTPEAPFDLSLESVAATTRIFLANPNPIQLSVALVLVKASGEASSPVERELPAGGYLEADVAGLFAPAVITPGAHLRVEFGPPGGIGFSLVSLQDTLIANPGLVPSQSSQLHSAQLASGRLGEVRMTTSLKVIHAGAGRRTFSLKAVDDTGDEAGVAGPFGLDPGQSLEFQAAQIFGWGDLERPAVVGSLILTADGPGLVGDVVFGEADRFEFGASLPLQGDGFTRAVFGQVANTLSEVVETRTFTGLAFLNPGQTPADVQVQVFGSVGLPTGQTQLQIGAGSRISEVLSVLVPETEGQTGGYVIVTSTEPLIGQQLFGNLGLDYLTAVPPSAVQTAQP